MTPEEVKTQIDALARKLKENAASLREMSAAIERLQRALEQEGSNYTKSDSRSLTLPPTLKS